MGLHWGTEALKNLIPSGMYSRLQSTQVDPFTPTKEDDLDELRFLNGESGEVMGSIPARGFLRLRRGKLRSLLREGVEVLFGCSLQCLEYPNERDGEGVMAVLEDGRCITAEIVIGADGARSTTRSLLLTPGLSSGPGPERGDNAGLRHLPYSATWVQARYTRDQALFLRSFHPLYIASIHPSGFFSFLGMHDVADPKKPETWTFFFYISWHSPAEEQEATKHWDNKKRLKQVKGFARDFAEPWKSAFGWLGEEHEVWYMNLSDFDPAKYQGGEGLGLGLGFDGRVTLAGDAAHAMTYQRGQGLNHSLTDARYLVDAIKEVVHGQKSRKEAIRGYEEEMIERAGAEVRMSAMNTEMVHDWDKVLESPVMRSGMNRQDR